MKTKLKRRYVQTLTGICLLLTSSVLPATGLHGMWVDDRGNTIDIIDADGVTVKLKTESGLLFEGRHEGDQLELAFPFTTFERTPSNLPAEVRNKLIGGKMDFKGTVQEDGKVIEAYFLVPSYNTETLELIDPVKQDIKLTRVPADLTVKFSGIDPEMEFNNALPLQLLRVTAETEDLDTLVARVRNQESGKGFRIRLRKWDEQDNEEDVNESDDNLWVSDPFLLSTEGANPNPKFTELPVCPGDTLKVSVARVSATLTVREPDDSYKQLPCEEIVLPVFTFEIAGDERVLINPQASPREKSLKVRLIDEKGEPMEDEPIAWQFEGFEDVLINYTDEKGEAGLDFALGRFAGLEAVVDGLPNGIGVPEGISKLKAFPADEMTAFFVDEAELDLEVDYVKPTMIEFIDQRGAVMTSFLDKDQFFIRVLLGRADKAQFGSNSEINVQLKGSGGDTLEVELERTAVPGVYESTVRTIATSDEVLITTGEIEAPSGGIITAQFGNRTHEVPFFQTKFDRAEAMHTAILDLYETALKQAVDQPGLPAEARELMQLKLRLIENARAFYRIEHATLLHRQSVMEAYLELLEADSAELGNTVNTLVRTSASARYLRRPEIDLVYITSGEERKINAAVNNARSLVVSAAWDIPSDIGDNVVNSIKGIPDAIISGPYTVISGYTVNGQRATGMERVLGGVETIFLIVGAEAAFANLFKLVRATRALARRGAASLRSAIRPTFARAVDPDGSLSPVVKSTVVKEAAETAAMPKRSKKLQAVERKLTKHKKKMDDLDKKIDEFKEKLDVEEQKLQELQRSRDNAPRSTWTWHNRIVDKWNHIQQIKRSIAKREAKRAKAEKKFLKAQEKIARIRGESLTPDALAAILERGDLPHPKHKINDLKVHKHYEDHVGGKLTERGYTRGRREPLETAYPDPLGEKFGAPASDSFAPGAKMRKEVEGPVMDHINYDNFGVADSKYYILKETINPDTALRYARELWITIEKGRHVQLELWKRKLGLSEANPAVMKKVLDSPVTIYTPKKLPDSVLRYLDELLQDARHRRTVNFEVEPVTRGDILGWAQ